MNICSRVRRVAHLYRGLHQKRGEQLEKGGISMSDKRHGTGTCRRIVWLCLLGIAMLVSGCMKTAVLLDVDILDAGEIRSATATQQKFNTLRFEPRGGKGNDFIGYILYRDGVDVVAGGFIQNRGKMTLSDVMAEYERYLRIEYVSNQPRAMVSAITREGGVIGYTLTCEKLEVELWEDISPKDPSKITVIMYYDDVRIED